MEKLTQRAFGKDAKFMSYTVIMKADSGLDVEWPPTCLYCGEEAS